MIVLLLAWIGLLVLVLLSVPAGYFVARRATSSLVPDKGQPAGPQPHGAPAPTALSYTHVPDLPPLEGGQHRLIVSRNGARQLQEAVSSLCISTLSEKSRDLVILFSATPSLSVAQRIPHDLRRRLIEIDPVVSQIWYFTEQSLEEQKLLEDSRGARCLYTVRLLKAVKYLEQLRREYDTTHFISLMTSFMMKHSRQPREYFAYEEKWNQGGVFPPRLWDPQTSLVCGYLLRELEEVARKTGNDPSLEESVHQLMDTHDLSHTLDINPWMGISYGDDAEQALRRDLGRGAPYRPDDDPDDEGES